jgi:DNA-binding NarL/FixJ family response regulator
LTKPRVLLADDSSRILTEVSQLLSTQFEVVDCVVNGEQAIEAALRLHPDVVVLDVLMPALDGLQAARRLRKLGFQAKIIFLTGLKDPGFISAAFDLRGNGYVLKSRLCPDLPLAILTALDGGKFCSCEPERDPKKNDIS